MITKKWSNHMSEAKHYDLIILGSGPAGYTAGVYAARANLNCAIITGHEVGGQLMTTTEVENWPGDPVGLVGPKLMERMKEHAVAMGCDLIIDHIKECKLSDRPFELTGHEGLYTSSAMIIATGASARYLGLESEKSFMGKGVSACATCDGFFYKGLPVAVVGGGSTAITEALYLANIASHVHLIHRRDQFRAEPVLLERLRKMDNVTFHTHYELEEVLGDVKGVNSILLKNNQSQTTKKVDVQGVFIAIGHDPNTSLFKDQLEMQGGYLTVTSGQTGNCTTTSIPGVFAAGDVMDSVYRQAITSAGTGCMAALDAEKYLSELAE